MTIDWETRFKATLDAALEGGYHHTTPDPLRVSNLRISSFPFCARHWLLSLPLRTAKRVRSTVSEAWFLHVGTVAHDVLQQSLATAELPMNAVLVQDWVCDSCGERHRFQPKPAACRFCASKNLRHAETQLRYSKHVMGHMDGCVAYPHEKGAHYSKKWYHVPIDYKTTMLKTVAGNAPTLPYKDNVEQLATYTGILAHQGYNTPGFILVYVPRDNPHAWIPKYTPFDPNVLRRVDRYQSLYVRARNVQTVEDARRIPPVVTENFKTECKHCAYKTVCEAAASDLSVLDPYMSSAITSLKKAFTEGFSL